MLVYQRVPSIWNNDMTRLPTSPHQDTVHFSMEFTLSPGRTFGIFWLHWHEFRPCFNQFETTSPEKQYVATSKSMIPYISIHHMNHIIIYLHMLPVTIFTPYLFWGKYTTPSVGARLKGPRNLRSKWGREIWGRAGLESDSRRFHWYSSHIDISFQS